MYSRIVCGTLSGVDAEKVFVESDVAFGFPSFHIVGLADAAIRESKERVRSAVNNAGFLFPQERVTVNLSPADRKKEGSHFDLPIALGILIAAGRFRAGELQIGEECACLGELTLDGAVTGIRGLLPILIDLRSAGIRDFIIPADNLKEACVVSDITIYPVSSLKEAAEHICGRKRVNGVKGGGERYLSQFRESEKKREKNSSEPDFADVFGQEAAKRALQIAAAGMHNILMTGSPGSGKSMMAKRLPGILPPLGYDEMIELTKIYSISGLLDESYPLMTDRPFRSPDTKITPAALAGGGRDPRPGEISLAHLGVLFLDELPEFSRSSLETLRNPMEEERIVLSRMGGRYVFPSKFLLAAAMNPCPCGYAGDPLRECSCTEYQIRRYRSKVSGPFLDRIDLFVHVNPPAARRRKEKNESASTSELREGVMNARKAQSERFKHEEIEYNSQMTPRHMEKYCRLDSAGEDLLDSACEALKLSSRACSRILKTARTIADIEGSDQIRTSHLAEAVAYKENGLR